MTRFRKKPVGIDAIQFTGTGDSCDAITAFLGGNAAAARRGVMWDSCTNDGFTITTLEGAMHCDVNDWLIQGVNAELYPCKPDIFEATYESSRAAL